MWSTSLWRWSYSSSINLRIPKIKSRFKPLGCYILAVVFFVVAGSTAIVTGVVQNTNDQHRPAVKKAPAVATVSTGYGMSLPAFGRLASDEQDAWLSDMRSLGISWLRINITWSDVQSGGPGSYNWSRYDTLVPKVKSNGFKINVLLNGAPRWARHPACVNRPACRPADYEIYAEYAKAILLRFGNQIDSMEVWNEPNIPSFWLPAPDPADYASMLKKTYLAIKSVAPTMPVVSAGLAPSGHNPPRIAPIAFTQGMYAAGVKGFFDIFGYHPYSYPAPPSAYHKRSGWSQMAQTSPSIRSVMADNGDTAVPLWATEVGAPTAGPGAVSECLQARILREAITLSKQFPLPAVTFIYSYRDRGTSTSNRENFFGVTRYDNSRKRSYNAVKEAIDD